MIYFVVGGGGLMLFRIVHVQPSCVSDHKNNISLFLRNFKRWREEGDSKKIFFSRSPKSNILKWFCLGFPRSALSSPPQSHLEQELTVMLITVLLVQFRFWLDNSVLTSWFLFCWFNFCSDLLISVLLVQFRSNFVISVLLVQFWFWLLNFCSVGPISVLMMELEFCRFVIMEFETEYWRRSPLI